MSNDTLYSEQPCGDLEEKKWKSI